MNGVSNRKYISLLGKNYPVIECNKLIDEQSSIADDIIPVEQPGDVISVESESLNEETLGQEISNQNQIDDIQSRQAVNELEYQERIANRNLPGEETSDSESSGVSSESGEMEITPEEDIMEFENEEVPAATSRLEASDLQTPRDHVETQNLVILENKFKTQKSENISEEKQISEQGHSNTQHNNKVISADNLASKHEHEVSEDSSQKLNQITLESHPQGVDEDIVLEAEIDEDLINAISDDDIGVEPFQYQASVDPSNTEEAISSSDSNPPEDLEKTQNNDQNEAEEKSSCGVTQIDASGDNEEASSSLRSNHDEEARRQLTQLLKQSSQIVNQSSQMLQHSNNLPDVQSDEIMQHSDVIMPIDDAPDNRIVSVSGKIDIMDYASSEWKGTTFKAKCLRKGYNMLIKVTGHNFLKQIRGDNYCALRATAYQILSQNVSLLKSHPDWEGHILSLVERLKVKLSLNKWTFAERLSSTPTNRFDVMHDCLLELIQQLNISRGISNNQDRQIHFSALFNSGSSIEIKLFEALKLLMLDKAVDLHEANSRGDEVPVFAWLLYARDTSMNPSDLMLNHLNPAGNTGGLEQVEMCLLGQALELTIRVVRPSKVEQEDFVTHYPDHMINIWDKINLIAEDDRHYNVVVP